MEDNTDSLIPVHYDELPHHTSKVQFAQYTCELPLLDNQKLNKNKKYILIGGSHKDETLFYEYRFDNTTNKIKWDTVNNIYGKKHADLKCIGLICAQHLHSFIIPKQKQDNANSNSNEYILVIGDGVYNIYDLMNDKWLIDESNMQNIYNKIHQTLKNSNDARNHRSPDSRNYRSLLIKNRLLLISWSNELYFYDLINLIKPVFLKKYTMVTQYDGKQTFHYQNHGMCLLSFDHDLMNNDHDKKDDDDKNKEYDHDYSCSVKILLFGTTFGIYPRLFFLKTFNQFTFTLSINSGDESKNKNTKILIDSICDENIKIDLETENEEWNENISYRDLGSMGGISQTTVESFGYQCFYNSKKEAILFVIGGLLGFDDASVAIICINLYAKEMIYYNNVSCVFVAPMVA